MTKEPTYVQRQFDVLKFVQILKSLVGKSKLKGYKQI